MDILWKRLQPNVYQFCRGTVQDRTPLTRDQLTQIHKEALACCCKFQALISVDETSEDIYSHCRCSYPKRGLVRADDHDAGAGDEDSLEHLLDMKVDEVTDLAVLAGVNTAVLNEPIATVELLQARSVSVFQKSGVLSTGGGFAGTGGVAAGEGDEEMVDVHVEEADEEEATQPAPKPVPKVSAWGSRQKPPEPKLRPKPKVLPKQRPKEPAEPPPKPAEPAEPPPKPTEK
ncbi:hypothetical protein AK812_SmicGene45096, partial [Symbiodinium microadriaticum]